MGCTMYKATHFCLCLILLTLFCFTQIGAGSSGRGRGSSPNRSNRNYGGYGYDQPPIQQQPQEPQTPKEYLDSKSGLSTFGIISIIFFVIMTCLLFYYGIICYPFLFRDEKKYRFMDVSSTITAATSRSMQSIENYPVDSKLEKSCV